jgi:hypothetical protein
MVQSTFSLTWNSIAVGGKGLTTNRIACYCADGVNLILGCLHGGKNLAEATVLECGREVMEDGMVGLILLENTKDATVHFINKGIADALGEHGVTSKWVHSAHHALVIRKNRNANMIAFPVNITLLDVVKGSLWLIDVPSAYLGKHQGTDLMPHKLQDFPINLDAGVCIRDIQIEIGCSKEHWGILLYDQKDIITNLHWGPSPEVSST